MNFRNEYFLFNQRLLRNVNEINEIGKCIKTLQWKPEFSLEADGINYVYQAGYYKAFDLAFKQCGWRLPPALLDDPPGAMGHYFKNSIFIEVQLGDSSTVFRDYLKYHKGFKKGLLTLAVLIVPSSPKAFFPSGAKNVQSMIGYEFASKYFKLMPVPIPLLLIGLLDEND